MSKRKLIDVQKAKFFRLVIDGIDTLTIQSVSGIGIEYETAEHSSQGFIVTTAGNKKAKDVTLKGVVAIGSQAKRDFYEWVALVGTGLPSEYKKDIVLQEISQLEGDVTREFLLEGAFPFDYQLSEYSLTTGDNTMEDFQLKVDELFLL